MHSELGKCKDESKDGRIQWERVREILFDHALLALRVCREQAGP